MRLSKRETLKALGAGMAFASLSSTAAATRGNEGGDESNEGGGVPVETVVAVPGDPVPENLAIAPDGTLYFGITAGEVWEVETAQTQATDLSLEDLTRVATLPGSVIGVEVVACGDLYVASTVDGEEADGPTGVWRVPLDDHEPYPYAAISGFPNDVLWDPDYDRLLVSESFGGAVYEVPLDAADPEATVWLDDDRLDTESFGANGLAFGRDGSAYVAVTRATDGGGNDVGRIVRAPVGEDGSAGDAETVVESEAVFGADGLTTEGPDVYVAANSRNEVVRVGPDGETTVVASGADGLVFPSDVLFGTTPRQRSDLFVCNFANPTPDDGAILRARPFAAEEDEDGDGDDGTHD
jgi:sugar lactone lactonase YvrE